MLGAFWRWSRTPALASAALAGTAAAALVAEKWLFKTGAESVVPYYSTENSTFR
jgi:hypothetical protein